MKCQAIIGDGLSMGRPCCGVLKFQEPLQNNWHRFCAVHFGSYDVCAIVGCENPVLEDMAVDPIDGTPRMTKKKMCSLPLHQQMEKKHHERSRGSFLYKEHLQHAKISQPVDSFPGAHQVPEQDIQEDFKNFVINDQDELAIHTQKNPGTVGTLDDIQQQDPCPSKSAVGNKTLKAQFGHWRTHNEQTLIRPCRVIFACATMFGAEAVSKVPCNGEECLLCSWGPETWTHLLWHQLWCEATGREGRMVQGCWDVHWCLALWQQTCCHPSVLSAALQSCSIPQVNGCLQKVVLQYICCRINKCMAWGISFYVSRDVTGNIWFPSWQNNSSPKYWKYRLFRKARMPPTKFMNEFV